MHLCCMVFSKIIVAIKSLTQKKLITQQLSRSDFNPKSNAHNLRIENLSNPFGKSQNPIVNIFKQVHGYLLIQTEFETLTNSYYSFGLCDNTVLRCNMSL